MSDTSIIQSSTIDFIIDIKIIEFLIELVILVPSNKKYIQLKL